MSNYLIVIIVPIILGLMFSAAKKAQAIETEDGMYLLEYARPIKYFAVGFTLLTFAGLTWLAFNMPIKKPDDLYVLIGLFVFLGLFAAYFFIEFFTVKIWVGPEGIRGTSGWRGLREYRWQEISRVSYSPSSMWFTVTAPGKASLRIHALISGLDKFQVFCNQHLAESTWAAASDKFKQDKRVNK